MQSRNDFAWPFDLCLDVLKQGQPFKIVRSLWKVVRRYGFGHIREYWRNKFPSV